MATKPICKVGSCDKTSFARGLCHTHWRRDKAGISLDLPIVRQGDLMRFIEDHMDYEGEDCLIWPFSKHKDGRASAVRFRGKCIPAARVMCIVAHGDPASDDLFATHTCGNGNNACVNPKHLRWATPAQNSYDRIEHGTMLLGEDCPTSKLSEAQVLEIFSLKGKETYLATAHRFNVSDSLVYQIQAKRIWKHLWQA